MKLRPLHCLPEETVHKGLKLVIADGLAAEAMTCFTSGTFLIAIALFLGASNFQVGLLATMPVFSNIFQLVTLWLMQKFQSRRAITVVVSLLARVPLLAIAVLPLLVSHGNCLRALIVLLSFHYMFGAIAGASWNAWMKDLVPQHILGNYFSHRTRLTQLLNVSLSLGLALVLDHVKALFPGHEISAYSIMFLLGGVFGIAGIYALYRTPEPMAARINENILTQISRPLRSKNFRRLLWFSGSWTFAVNLAAPFLSVYMMKSLHLPLTTIVALGIIGQIAGICCVKSVGKYSDQYSNKTIILCFAPLYSLVMIGWSFASMINGPMVSMLFMALLQILTGIATAGVNLALSNIGIKLSPPAESASYLASKNIFTALFGAAGPVAGGLLADFFAQHSLKLGFEWTGGNVTHYIGLMRLEQWSFFFIIGPAIALCSIRLLKGLHEEGEIHRVVLMREVKNTWKMKLPKKIDLRRLPSGFNAPVLVASMRNRFDQIFLYRMPAKRKTEAERA